jgi:ubiquinone/menaquinone biosynthesis C-methylase UbiE
MDNYNAIADNYDDSEQNAITLWRLGYPVVAELLGDVTGKSCLDYGCGTGTFCRFLHSKGATLTGVDVSENMINVAKRNSNHMIDYHTISDNINFLSDNKFDFVVSNFVLCTISSCQEISLILDQLYRVLKKEGRLFMMNSNWDKSNGKEFISFKLEYSKNLFPGQAVRAIIKSDPPILLNDYFWPIEEYCKLLEKSGFRIHDVRENIATSDNISWLDEKEYPPYYIISAEK